jgi:hypothetical protein
MLSMDEHESGDKPVHPLDFFQPSVNYLGGFFNE